MQLPVCSKFVTLVDMYEVKSEWKTIFHVLVIERKSTASDNCVKIINIIKLNYIIMSGLNYMLAFAWGGSTS